eukprot:gb/GECG01016251.1/.p1 GENE.gb/GECG01016251.1/~~gb/GECG01016251.1/.p1  ORF type:complete len:324 (+),score=35.63 gb/GECG01016251.1/:1-972(+)
MLACRALLSVTRRSGGGGGLSQSYAKHKFATCAPVSGCRQPYICASLRYLHVKGRAPDTSFIRQQSRREFSTSSGSHNNKSSNSSDRSSRTERDEKNVQYAIYALSGIVGLIGLSYAAVPLYRMFCQATGFGGTTQTADVEKFKRMKPVEGARPITVYFAADTSDSMPWKFVPQQRAVRVVPGETALAFFRAHNPTKQPITGVSTYNVTPMKAGVHFNKIQCFCFEEQRLRPKEEIDMPVFFYIDPDFVDDPSMHDVRDVTLSYTFFRTGDEQSVSAWDTDDKKEDKSDSERIKEWTEEMRKHVHTSADQKSRNADTSEPPSR